MIKTEIKKVFPRHKISTYSQDIYIADYTDQTKDEEIKRSVEVNTELPADIEFFCLHNPLPIEINVVSLDRKSFVDEDGESQTQCECVTFPSDATDSSWVLFLELKYCKEEKKRKQRNLPKAIDQLLATHSYYKNKEIITIKNASFLIAAFPTLTSVPFRNSTLTASYLQNLKKKENIILRVANEAIIKSLEMLSV